MTHWQRFGVRIFALLVALVVSTLVGSVIQTQINLHAISEIGPVIELNQRINTTLHDLIFFAPLFAVVMAVTLIIAIPIAHFVSTFQKRQFTAWCIVAGGVGLYVAFQLINAFTPPPTLIAATRGSLGTLLMILSGCLAGYLYARLTRSLRKVNPLKGLVK